MYQVLSLTFETHSKNEMRRLSEPAGFLTSISTAGFPVSAMTISVSSNCQAPLPLTQEITSPPSPQNNWKPQKINILSFLQLNQRLRPPGPPDLLHIPPLSNF